VRYAIISDIHGNLEALEAVLRDVEDTGAEEVLCLGDLVGYGANPNECVERVRERASAVVAGNHDWAAVGKLDLDYFNSAARAAAEWTGRVLDEENKRYLRGLPLTGRPIEDLLLVHSSPVDPQAWRNLFHPGQAALAFRSFKERLCLVGHTHQPVVFEETGGLFLGEQLLGLKFEDGSRYMVNVGSVGQPRDGDGRAAYCILDTEEMKLALRRVEYDVETAQAKIVMNGLPRTLAERLPLGL